MRRNPGTFAHARWSGIFAVILCVCGLFPVAAMATDVSGNINVSTVWTVAESPYDVLTDVTVIDGVTLTIEPGVQVRFSNASSNDVELIVNGTLNAVGTAALPIRFEGAVTTSSNYWEGIVTGPSAVFNLQHAVIGNTDFGLELNNTPPASITVRDVTLEKFRSTAVTTTAASGTLNLTRVAIRGTGVGTGMLTNGASLVITDSSILDVALGVDVNNASATVTGTVFRTAASGTGLDVYRTTTGTSTVSITYSTFWSGSYAVQFGKSSTSSSMVTTVGIDRSIMEGQTVAHTYDFGRANFGTISQLSVTNSVYSGPSTPFSQTLPSPDSGNLRYRSLMVDPAAGNFAPTNRSPARYISPSNGTLVAGAVDYTGDLTGAGLHGFWYENATFESGSVNDVAGDMIIAPGAVLTFRPDATLRMATTDNMLGGVDQSRVEIRIEGRLNSDGTLSRPVRFTSAAASPARNNWYGVIVPSTAELASIRELDIAWARVGMTVQNRNLAMGNSNIHDCGVAGLLVEGGTPSFDGLNLYNNQVGAQITTQASVSFVDVDVYNNSANGVELPSGSVNWTTGRVYGNGADGVSAQLTTNGTYAIYLDRLTIANNAGDGIETNRVSSSSSRTLSLVTRASSITNNTGAGYRDNASSSGPTTWSCQNSNLWQNNPNAQGISDTGTTCFSWNPLYVDAAARDYTPTQNSPLRGLGPSAGPVGALDYAGALGPQVMGFIWDDTTFTLAGSPYTLLGDLLVTAGRRVTFEPGVQFRVVPNADGMGGGQIANRTEVRFLKDSLFTFPTNGPAVVFTPNTTSPVGGSWWGTRFDDTIGSVEWMRVEYPQFGFNVVGPRSPTFEDVEVRYGTTNGFLIQNVTNSTNFADILAATLIGTNFSGSSRGVEATSSIVRMRSSYATHWGFGYFAAANVAMTPNASHTLTNNTFVAQTYGIYADRTSSSSTFNQTLNLQNNLIANSSVAAVFDQDVSSFSGYNSTFTLTNNGLFNQSTVTVQSGTTNTGSVTTNPNIEDDDWAAFPRWWDGQVFRTSPVINVGTTTAPAGLTRDLFGRARVLSSRVDIGAIEHDFTANQEPRADAVARSIVAPTGELVTLDGSAAVDLDGTIATAFWTMSDGTVTAGQTIQHTFATRGNAEAYITIVDDDGAPDHARVLVNVNDRPVAEANGPYFADVSTPGAEEPVAFRSDNSSDTETAAGSLTYVWNFGDGTPPVASRNPLHPYTTAGLFIATLTVTDAAGLSATDTAVVEISGGAADTQGPLLQHTEVSDGRPAGTPITINLTAQDQTGVQSVTMFYRTIGTIPAEEVELTNSGGNNWTGVIAGTDVTAPGIEYWFSSTDTTPSGNTSRLPATASTYFNFTVSGDFVPPVITHTEVGDGQAPGSPVTVTATITDTTGVGVANLYYGSLSGSYASVTMTNVVGNTWSAQVPAVIVNAPGVKYYIEAIDTSPTPNRAVLPSGAPTSFFDFTVSSGDTTPPLIALTPVADNRPAGTAVTVNASIVDASGTVSSAALYYRTAGSSGAYTQVAMTRGAGSAWSGVIPAGGVNTPGVQYYVTGTDPAGNVGTEPSGAPATPLSFTVVTADTTPPTIVHTPIANGQPVGVAVVIEATITDASPLQTVRVHYKRSTSSSAPPWPAVDMTLVSGNLYRAEIPDFAVNIPAMVYYIRAIDSAGNTALLPTTSTTTPYQFSVGASDVAGPTLTVTPVAAGRPAGTAVTVTATATDTSGIGSMTLFYRTTGGGAYTSLVMSSTGGSGYSATIPGAAVVAPGVDYYVVATDAATVPNSTTAPATAPGTPSSFTVVVPDTTAPTISTTAVPNGQVAGTAVTVTSTITDATGVGSARLFYRTTGSGAAFTFVNMTNTAGNTWSATIPAAGVVAPGVDYYVTATDTATAPNTATAPTTAPGTPSAFTVVTPDVIAPTITLTPVSPNRPAGTAVTVTATITDTTGVASARLFYRATGGGAFTQVNMTNTAGTTWSASIPAGSVTAPGVDYYVTATDSAPAANTATAPVSAPGTPATFTVISVDSTAPTVTLSAVANGRPENVAVTVNATITDATGVATATLYHRITGAGTWNTVTMTRGAGDAWSGVIPAGSVRPVSVQYYVQAVDSSTAANTGFGPSTAPGTPSSFTVTPADSQAPAITHTLVSTVEYGEVIALSATITDNVAVTSAQAFVSIDAINWTPISLSRGLGDTWGTTFLTSLIPDGTPTVYYYLAAEDAAGNRSFLPAAGILGPQVVTVTYPDVTPPTLSVDALASPSQAGVAIGVTARASDPSGVSNVTIFYRSNGTGSYNALATAGTGPYTATIPAAAVVTGTLQVYAQATDTEGNSATSATQTITIEPAPDTTAPTITLTPVPNGQAAGTAVTVSATITDDSGIASATLFHRVQGAGAYTSVAMTTSGGGNYAATIPGVAVGTPAVEYYVRAVDGSASSNAANVPAAAPTVVARFTVTSVDSAGPTITHTPPALPILAGANVNIAATLADSTGVASAEVYWRTGSTGGFTTVAMTNAGGNWSANIGPVTAPEFTYYIRAVDTLGNASTDPADAPTSTRQRTVTVPDTTGPTITHTPLTGNRTPGVSIAIEANVTDATGVSTVRVRYRTIGGTTFTSIDLANAGSGRYTGTIPGAAVVAPGFEYYLEATDTAAAANSSVTPTGAPTSFYTVTTVVVGPDLTAPTIVHTPIAGPVTASVSQIVEASAADPSGVREVTLNYRVQGDDDWIAAPMTLVGLSWRATIPARNMVSPGIEYYLTATDNAAAANRGNLPTTAPADVFSFDVITPDTTGPSIVVTQYTEPVAIGVDLPFTATVTDASGVASVTLNWRQTGTPTFAQLTMTSAGGDSYTATVPGSLVDEAGLEYWVSAVDASAASNTATAPVSAPTTVYTVETFSTEDNDAPVIVVTEVASPQPSDTGVAVVAEVTDASEIVSVVLYARSGTEGDWSIIDMEPLEGDTFSGVIDASIVVEGTVYYYVLAEDSEGNVALEPLTAPTETYSFEVLPIEEIDTTAPAITHVPASELPTNADAIIEVLVTDASGVNSVTVFYTSGSVTEAVSVSATNEADDNWVAVIPAIDVTGDALSYYIIADDLAVAGNVGTLPADAPASTFSVTLVQGGGDVGTDVGPDAGPDAGTDAGPDAGDTSGTDGSTDVESDGGGDVSIDGSFDGSTDPDASGGGSGNSSDGGCSASPTAPAAPAGLGLVIAAALMALRRRSRS